MYIFSTFYNISQSNFANFTKHRMLFQAVVIFLPILNFFQISYKGGKVHSLMVDKMAVSYD